MSNQNRVYILSGQKIIYILNARFNLADRHCCVSVGDLRGTSIYHYDANGNSVKSSDWLSIGKSADFEARSQNNNKTNDTILLSKSDAKWLNANLPEHVEMIIYRLVWGKMDSLKNYGSGQICPSILPFAISYCFYCCFYMMDWLFYSVDSSDSSWDWWNSPVIDCGCWRFMCDSSSNRTVGSRINLIKMGWSAVDRRSHFYSGQQFSKISAQQVLEPFMSVDQLAESFKKVIQSCFPRALSVPIW